MNKKTFTEGWNAALKMAAGLIVDDGNPSLARQRILDQIDNDPGIETNEFESDYYEDMGDENE